MRLRTILSIVVFILRNTYYFIHLENIAKKYNDNKTIIMGAAKKELKKVYEIYSYFNNGNQLAIEKRIVYYLMSKKFVFIAKDAISNKIIGIELYYVNERDIVEKTIHQGFRGILPEWQGKKIGTMITAHAINHFNNIYIKGISSRVSLNNLASLTSNMKLGFKPVERYFDKDMNEERYYMICSLNNKYPYKYLEIDDNVK